MLLFMQPWETASPNQTAVPFEKQYTIAETGKPILKQEIGMIRLKNGVEVHFQSFGVFHLDLWDDVMEKFLPLTKRDILYVGEHILLEGEHRRSNACICYASVHEAFSRSSALPTCAPGECICSDL